LSASASASVPVVYFFDHVRVPLSPSEVVRNWTNLDENVSAQV
jgi:hypothetical protein